MYILVLLKQAVIFCEWRSCTKYFFSLCATRNETSSRPFLAFPIFFSWAAGDIAPTGQGVWQGCWECKKRAVWAVVERTASLAPFAEGCGTTGGGPGKSWWQSHSNFFFTFFQRQPPSRPYAHLFRSPCASGKCLKIVQTTHKKKKKNRTREEEKCRLEKQKKSGSRWQWMLNCMIAVGFFFG